MALGYFYPAYKCFKAIDSGKPKSEQLHVWCQYWIIIAVFTGFERVADTFISWLPFYSGAKLAFVVYLWHPDTKGTEYIYQTFVKPYLSQHTESVDLNLVLVRDETVRVLTILWNRFVYYVHLKFSGVLHQNAVPSPNIASPLVQDGLQFYPSISSSFYGGKMKQQQWSVPGHQPLATQSALWAHEQYQRQPQASSYPVQPPVDLHPRPHVQPTQFSSHHTLPSEPATKPLNSVAVTKSPTPLSTAGLKTYEGKEEPDFEMVHSNEVLIPGSSGAPDLNKRHASAQGAQSRWRLWW